MNPPTTQSAGKPHLHLSELLGALSHALDMVEGQPAGHCVRCCWIGVHIGQDDLPLVDVRRIAPALLVGVSTHNEAQLRAAIETKPDYLAFGPVFGTTSKDRPDPTVGLEGVRLAASIAGDLPIVFIGGITRVNVADVRAAGARWVAVISDLVTADMSELEARARAFAP